MIIPYKDINPDTLDNLLHEFVLREGTDYGAQDVSIEEKVAQVKRQLKEGSAVIVFSELHETINILPKDTFEQMAEEESPDC
ncbi:YheU family protein [Thalassotalea euphylliae]|uniref:YheU family protein n=1 Tax=Thalassotalea euphylliae TaxID=1655234 RepID=UPI00362A3C8D